jgi:hypothetical protein
VSDTTTREILCAPAEAENARLRAELGAAKAERDHYRSRWIRFLTRQLLDDHNWKYERCVVEAEAHVNRDAKVFREQLAKEDTANG